MACDVFYCAKFMQVLLDFRLVKIHKQMMEKEKKLVSVELFQLPIAFDSL